MDATQSRLKGFLIKAKGYIIPFDKRKLAMHAICGCHAVLMIDILLIVSRFILSDFRLPLPFLGAVAAMVMLLYQVCIIIIIFYTYNKELAALLSEYIIHRLIYHAAIV